MYGSSSQGHHIEYIQVKEEEQASDFSEKRQKHLYVSLNILS